MKKSIAVGMALLAVVIFSGCSTQKEDNSAKSNNSKTEQTTKKKTKKNVVKTKKEATDSQTKSTSLDEYFSVDSRNIVSDDEGRGYEIVPNANKLAGSYSFKKDNKTSLLTINKNGTYTIFSEFPETVGLAENLKTRGHYYFDKDGEIHQEPQLMHNAVESGLLFRKYGKTYMHPIDAVMDPYSLGEDGQLVSIARDDLLKAEEDFKESSEQEVDLSDTTDCDVIKTTDNGISLQTWADNDTGADGATNEFINKYEEYRNMLQDADKTVLNFEKVESVPKETSQSASQFVKKLKKGDFSNLNDFYQKMEFNNDSDDVKPMKANLNNLQDGYTSDNKKVKIKYAYVLNLKPTFNDDYQVYVTNGKKVYHSETLSNLGSKVTEWNDGSEDD
ncbi:hypothetical protein [Companilactobacillus futsaii]|uniref:hypothetical protein n=1 Tax=Companilactobacillus futsaii TaxID=938155 RepID=UPI00189E070D|nr:hypothetical protein [Companilactobacillus futsaii]